MLSYVERGQIVHFVQIYDSNKNLVVIGKISQPIALVAGETIMIELSIDF